MTITERIALILQAVDGLDPAPPEALALMRALTIRTPTAHQHTWFRCLRSASLGVEIFDCACGARKRQPLGTEDATIDNPGTDASGSMARVLIDASMIDASPFLTQ